MTAHSGTENESLHLKRQRSACQSNPVEQKRKAVKETQQLRRKVKIVEIFMMCKEGNVNQRIKTSESEWVFGREAE